MSEPVKKPTWLKLLELAKMFLTWWGTKAPPPEPLPEPEPRPGPVDSTNAALLRLHNEYRMARNLPPLTANATLTALARAHADAMGRAERLSHDVGGSFRDRIAAERSLKYREAAENIATARSADAAFAAWLDSEPHLRSIVRPTHNQMGAAVNQDGPNPGRYWCVIFIAAVSAKAFTAAGVTYFAPAGVEADHE
jgi:uncharacterized protein YkwD